MFTLGRGLTKLDGLKCTLFSRGTGLLYTYRGACIKLKARTTNTELSDDYAWGESKNVLANHKFKLDHNATDNNLNRETIGIAREKVSISREIVMLAILVAKAIKNR